MIYAANYANYIDTVALMIMGSEMTDWHRNASHLFCDVQASLRHRLAQGLGEADPFGDLGNHHQAHFKLDQEAISPKPTVITLNLGHSLPCGIGLWLRQGDQYDVNSSEIRRWELGASAIVEILKSSPRKEYNLTDTVVIHMLSTFLEEHGLRAAFEEHIPNFSEDMLSGLRIGRVLGRPVLRDTGALFLYLLRFLIPLTTSYGGIHLLAWNFNFPSRIESIIWRTACFIIMGSDFALLARPSWEELNYYIRRGVLSRGSRIMALMRVLRYTLGYGSAGLLLLCYAASRVYLVVESFISLRHVPIGVYAAVPWVQNIPHV